MESNKKKIVFRTGYLGLGAIEQLAFDIVQYLSEEYNIVLAIENEENNYLVEKLSKNIEYFYIKDKKFLSFMRKIREKKKNIFYKLLYNLLLNYEKTLCKRKINEWVEKNSGADIFIDYDGMALKYAKGIKIDKKIVWQHTAISGEKHLGRMENRLKSYDKIVLICNDMKKNYGETFPSLKEKFVTKYNFLNIERIQEMMLDEPELTLEEKELQKENYCVAVARLDEPKDFTTLLKAFKILKEKGIKEKLYIIGEGELRESIEKEILEKDLKDTVFLMGRKKNPYTWMKNSQMFLHSSKREGLGMVLLEAMACSKVVISSDCPVGPSEILENGKSGKLFKVGDYEKLAQLIEEILKNREERELLLEKSKRRVDDFKKDKILKEYSIFLKNFLKEEK